jgi:hypothetical protein
MNQFYQVAITKHPIGSAVEYREPPIQGKIIVKVADSTTVGAYRLIVVDCDETQHQTNSLLPGVKVLLEPEAIQLAAIYQPQRTIKRFDPKTRKEESVVMPAADLKRFYVAKPAVEKATKAKK